MKWFGLKLAAVGSLTAIATALTPPANAAGNVLRWANSTDVTSMDPDAVYVILNASFLGNIYEGLVRLDRNFKIQPALATSWTRVDDYTWRFKLRPNVKFQNGDPFTADDVAASLMRAADANSPYRPAAYWIKDVKKIDDLTVEVISTEPHATALNDLTGLYILDKKWMAEHDALRAVNPAKGEKSYADEHANGTGPFQLVSRRPDDETVLRVNPNWWDKPEHNISEVIYRPMSSDATRVSALLSGELDLVTPAPLQDVGRLEHSDGVKPMVGTSTRIISLNFYPGAAKLNDSNVTDKNPLADIRVRKALYQGLNFDLLSSRIMRGLTKPAGTSVAPQVQGYSKALDVPSAPYDPTAAKKLLADAGYPNGFEIGFDCPVGNYVNSEQLCQAIGSMWSQIGVKVHLNMVPFSNYTGRVLGKKTDVFILGWSNAPQLDAFSYLTNVMSSKGTWNPGGYKDPKVDDLIEQVRREPNMEKRLALMADAFRLYKQDFATIPLFAEPMIWGAKKNLNIFQGSDSIVRLYWARFN
jgi:peptide/nickel transport system substrate-binding protein